MKHDVFISYSAHDKAIADAICSKLENYKIRCWIAPRDILPGIEFGEAIIDAIVECSFLIVVFSAKANESPQVRREVERAVNKGKIIIPFRIEDILPTKAMEFALSNTHWLDAMTTPLESHIAKLSDTIYRLLNIKMKEPQEDDGSIVLKPHMEQITTKAETIKEVIQDNENITISQPEVIPFPDKLANTHTNSQQFPGQIIRKDGSTENFTQFSFGQGDTRYFPFATDIDGKNVREINGNDIFRIDMLGSSRLIENGVYLKNIWAKAMITFRDEKKLENVYLNIAGLVSRAWNYRSDFYLGKIDDEVLSIIFWESPKPVKYK